MKCLICDKSSEIHCAMIVVMKKDARIVIHIKQNFKNKNNKIYSTCIECFN